MAKDQKGTGGDAEEAEIVEAEVVEEGGDESPGTGLAAPAPAASPAAGGGSTDVVTLWNTHDPDEIIERASKIATALDKVIKAQGMTTSMGGDRKHVNIEAWQTAGTLLGLQAVVVDVRRIEPRASFEVKSKRKKWGKVDGARKVTEETEDTWTCEGWSYTAIAETRTIDGRLVGRAEATCAREESKWARSDDYAVKSMAQTRACSKALRQALGFIIGMAGYQTTPAEEMDGVERDDAGDVGPPFGPAVKDADKSFILGQVATLLTTGQGNEREAAKEVLVLVKDLAGGYVPLIVGQAFDRAAEKLRELDPSLTEDGDGKKPDEQPAPSEKQEADQLAAEAEAAEKAADKPVPDNTETPPPAKPAAGGDDDIPF